MGDARGNCPKGGARCYNVKCALNIAPEDVLCPGCARRKATLTRLVSVPFNPARMHLAGAMLAASKKVKVPGPTLLYTLPFFSLELLRAIASGHVGIPPSRVKQTKGMKGRVGQPVQYRLCLTSHAEVEAFICCAVRRPEHGVAFESPLRSVFAVVPPVTFVLGGKLAPLYGDTDFNLRVVWG